MSKPTKASKTPVSKEPPVPWDEQVKQIDLDAVHECRKVKFALLNAEEPSYLNHIEMFQNYSYVRTTSPVKPIIFEEIMYILKHYPAWDRPYVPQAAESYLEQACSEARNYMKRFTPIPLNLMTLLIKIRAILMIYEDIYYETHPADRPSLYQASSVSPCLSESQFSFESSYGSDKNSPEAGTLADDIASLASEAEYDRDTMAMVYNVTSPLLQGYIMAMQLQHRREPISDQLSKTPTRADLLPWVVRHCKQKKIVKPKAAEAASKKKAPVTEQPVTTPKLLYMVLTGFYDVSLLKELHAVGIDLCCLIAFGGKTEGDDANRKTEAQSSDSSEDGWSVFINPVYNFALQKRRSPFRSRKHVGGSCADLRENLIMTFWIEIEELCETSLPYSKDIIWFHYTAEARTDEEKEIASEQYWKRGAKILRLATQYLQSVAYLAKYHQLFLRSLNVYELGETPEMISVGKMFYYNETLRRIPPDCIHTQHVLDGLLDEVCHRVPLMDSDWCLKEECAQMETSRTNKKCKKLLGRLFRSFKFSYMPVDPIEFLHMHPHLAGTQNKVEVRRDHFEMYDADNLELETRYYPKLKNQLKAVSIEYLKKSFPAHLWDAYDCCKDFEVRTLSSHVYQTWLSLIKLTSPQCQERMAIRMCDNIKCKEKTKLYVLCKLHDYFVKPVWVSPAERAKQINEDTCSIVVSSPQVVDSDNFEKYPHGFYWQEHLTPEVFLQQAFQDFIYYDCFDHIYVPFLDQIVMRFHDPTDEFGAAVYVWEESIRSPVGLYNFFKHSIFEDSKWLRDLEDTLTNLKPLPRKIESVTQKNQSSQSLPEDDSCKFEDIPFILTAMETFENVSLKSPLKLTAFNLDDRAGAGGVTTIFHSTEGLKITVDVSHIFNIRTISLKVQGDGHLFVLHANPADPFLFHFTAVNGTKIVFGKPEVLKRTPKDELTMKKHKSVVEKGVFLVKEIHYVHFGKRSKFAMKRYVPEKVMKNLLSNILAQTNKYSSSESLKNVESGHKIVIKSATSLTDVRKRTNQSPKAYQKFFKELHKAKRDTIPHFKILSSALHKRKYVSALPATIILNFADRSVPIKFMPNINVSKRIECSKCPELDLDFDEGAPAGEPDFTEEPDYDIRITLPSGLQILTFPDPKNSSKYIISQRYLTTGPMNDPVKDEVSRTFTSQGYIRIKYRDGSMKMIGINGRTIIGKVHCLNRKPIKRKSKVYTENLTYHKYVRLQKSIHKKINRYQRRIVDKPGVRYLNQKLTKRDKYFKALLDGFKNSPCLLDYSKLTLKQLLSPVIFKIRKDSFKDHHNLHFSTKDSFTSINHDGEQITYFTDGTKITSWYKMQQEMVVVQLDPSIGKLELEPDDYTCNFLVPKTGAWIDISLSLQFEHPQYATVVYKSDGREVSIFLPDNMEIRIKADGTYFINLNDTMYANISTKNITIRSNFCKKCYDSCETVMHIDHLYDNDVDVPPNDILLEAKDNFNKCFKVAYGGSCHKNKNYQVGENKTCSGHRTDTMEKFYSCTRNLNGIAYWTNLMFMNRVVCMYDKMRKEHVKYYLDEKQTLRAYEITTYQINHYCDRFIMPYRKGDPPALKGFNPYPKPSGFNPTAYIKKRLLEVLPDPEAIVPLLDMIIEWKVLRPWELHLPTKEMAMPPPEPKPYVVSSTENINLRLPPYFAETAIEHFKKLNTIAKNFKLGLYENVDSFTKAFSKPVCKCREGSRTEPTDQELFLDAIFERYKYKTSKARLKMAYSQRFPLVPVNSFISDSTATKYSYGTASAGKKDVPSQEPSVQEFTTQPVPLEKSRMDQFEKKLNETLAKPAVPFLQPGFTEWRKANLNESSSSTATELLPPKKKTIKRKRHFKTTGTVTVQPFDLLNLQEPPIPDTTGTSTSVEESIKKLTKNIKAKSLEEPTVVSSAAEYEMDESTTISSDFFTSQLGPKDVYNLNTLYNRVSDIKCSTDLSSKLTLKTKKIKTTELKQVKINVKKTNK